MIVDHNKPESNDMPTDMVENPPPYALASGQLSSDHKKPNEPPVIALQLHTPPSLACPGPAPVDFPSPTVYHYQHPHTGERIASLLPPDHPEMICLQQGQHVRETKYGLIGVLAAIFWFPLGIGLCLLDRRVRCSRCGLHIDDGLCG